MSPPRASCHRPSRDCHVVRPRPRSAPAVARARSRRPAARTRARHLASPGASACPRTRREPPERGRGGRPETRRGSCPSPTGIRAAPTRRKAARAAFIREKSVVRREVPAGAHRTQPKMPKPLEFFNFARGRGEVPSSGCARRVVTTRDHRPDRARRGASRSTPSRLCR